MKKKLSIIIPCYNCKKTLKESIDSCYEQGLSETEFEIVIVDDASTDGTARLIDKLIKIHGNIIRLDHKTNRGGGAARNTGIKASNGELVYCLDSDNFFGPDKPLNKMITFIDTFKLDGVSFHKRRFFNANDHKHYDTHINEITDRDIKLEDLFTKNFTLLDNFLYTKASYLKTKGYPEHHGFDTQCFEIRYLASGNRIRTCKDTIFYHRRTASLKSYFEREYDKGLFSRNYFLIIEDIFENLSTKAKKTILDFDIFSRNSMRDNLMLELQKLHSTDLLFDYECKKIDAEPEYLRHYESSMKSYNIGLYSKALRKVEAAINCGLISKIAYYHRQRCLSGINAIPISKIDDIVSKMPMFQSKRQILNKFYNRIPVVNRLITKIIKWKKKKK